MKDRNFIVIRADGSVFYADVDDDDKIVDFEAFNALKAYCVNDVDLFEVVHTPVFPHFLMLVDEEGKFKNSPVNRLASLLYASPYDDIVGDVVLVAEDEDDPSEMRYLTDIEVTHFYEEVTKS